MNQTLFVLSQFGNIASALRDEIDKRKMSNTGGSQYLHDLQVIEVKLQNAIPGEYISEIEITSNDLKELNDAEILLIDLNLVTTLLRSIDNCVATSDDDQRRSCDLRLGSIRWLQITSGGVLRHFDELEKIVERNRITVSRCSDAGHALFDYLFAQIANHERHFLYLHTLNRVHKQWNDFKVFKPFFTNYRKTNELSVAVLGGTGAVGSYVCTKLSSLGMKTFAYGRTARPDSWIEQFCKDTGVVSYSTKLDQVLPQVDYVICLLPGTKATDQLLDNGVLKLCKRKKPVLINVGRGNIITESGIVEALDHGWISYAILDVFQVEPLPSDSVLWSRDDVLITPHVAAIPLVHDVSKFFLDNYLNYQQKKPLNCKLDFSAGY